MKQIITDQYKTLAIYVEILHFVSLIPLLYNFIPVDEKASETLYIDADSIDNIVDSLEENGYTVTFLDKMMINFDTLPKSGWYHLKKGEDGRFVFFKNIYKHRAKTMDIVVYAGETSEELIKRVANDIKLEREKLREVYTKLSKFKEADIFAGHYRVARVADEKSVMVYLFRESDKILDLFVEKTFKETPSTYELKLLLTIASIIQKESNSIEEMPIISGVIYNRLAKNMKLQMDATLNYGKWSHSIVTPERIKSDNSFYNTYKHKGLPPHPLATVSVNALQAAMFPQKNKHLFFMLKPDGKHQFCETYEEHLNNIRIFREYQKKRKKEKLAKQKAKDLEKKKVSANNESNRSLSVKKD